MVSETPGELAIRVYRELHRRPEIGLRVPRTLRTIEEALAGLPLELHRGEAIDSLVAVLPGPAGGPVAVLRADTDALPIEESPEHELRSEIAGAMHACGHDGHAAMLVGAAHALAASERRPPGPVVMLWQPGEEGYEGMAAMIDEGLMELVDGLGPVQRSYGLHLLSDPGVPRGVFTGRAGPSHASTATFEIALEGRGGHAAFPHLAKDPVPACAALISALNVAMTRTRDPFDPAVLTVGAVAAGDAPNVIAERAVLRGTIRAYSAASGEQIVGMVRQTADGIAAAHGLRAEVRIESGYPSVVNDAACVEHFADVVTAALGEGRFQPMRNPLPAGDDYARLLERIPGAFFMLGAGLPDASGAMPPNHSPGVRFDESVLVDGVAALAAIALDPLSAAGAGETAGAAEPRATGFRAAGDSDMLEGGTE